MSWHASIDHSMAQSLRWLEQAERQLSRVIRMLPRAADVLRERVGDGNLGLRDLHSIVQGRNVLFGTFSGPV